MSFILQLAGQYDVVVNCTGLGSIDLVNDKKLVPNRGHVIKVGSENVIVYVYMYNGFPVIDCNVLLAITIDLFLSILLYSLCTVV